MLHALRKKIHKVSALRRIQPLLPVVGVAAQ